MTQTRSLCAITCIFFMIQFHPFPTQAASFDCRKAIHAVESMICKDVTLSKLDDDLANTYAKALILTQHPEALKRKQREWVKRQRNNCKNMECLKYDYQHRIEELRNNINITNHTIKNADIIGEWESYDTAFYRTGSIKITPLELFLEACKVKFHLIKNNGSIYYFISNSHDTCNLISDKESIGYIKIISYHEEISVRYYKDSSERTFLGEGTYNKVK